MFCCVLVLIMLGVQPVCTESTFSRFIQPSLHGDVEVVARAIFEEYLENIADIENKSGIRLTPIEFVTEQRDEEIQADALFDSLLDSLALLDDNPDWFRALKQLRKHVLLRAREANNPWPNTVWYDISLHEQTNAQFLHDFDVFLRKYVDIDRNDRFAAKIAILMGDKEACVNAEQRTMERWGIYNKLIEPFANSTLFVHLYPAIPNASQVGRVYFRIAERVKDTSKIEAVGSVFGLFKAMYEKQVHSIVETIKDARIKDGVDPLSSGCGAYDKTRILVLYKTAALHELLEATIQSMVQILTAQERQSLELDK